MNRIRQLQVWEWGAVFVVGAAIAASGCGLEAGDSSFGDQRLERDASNGSDSGSADELGGGQGAGTMSGTWLKLHMASTCVMGQEQITEAYYLVDIEEDGAALHEELRLCQLEMTPVLGFRPVATPEAIDAFDFTTVDHGIITGLLEGATYSSATEVGLWGVELDDPVSDSMPVDADDDRVVDGDGDGNPGISMKLEGSGCERFTGQRQIVRYFGTLKAPNDIRGGSASRTEVEVYGGSDIVCELAPDVEANDEYSFFRMVRVDGLGGAIDVGDGDEITCEDVESHLDKMWQEAEPHSDHCD